MREPTITCRRCGDAAPALRRPPFRTELGERIAAQVCAACWREWLQHQRLLINHYGLDPRDAEARSFLYDQIERVLLRGEEPEGVDTSQQGTVEW